MDLSNFRSDKIQSNIWLYMIFTLVLPSSSVHKSFPTISFQTIFLLHGLTHSPAELVNLSTYSSILPWAFLHACPSEVPHFITLLLPAFIFNFLPPQTFLKSYTKFTCFALCASLARFLSLPSHTHTRTFTVFFNHFSSPFYSLSLF